MLSGDHGRVCRFGAIVIACCVVPTAAMARPPYAADDAGTVARGAMEAIAFVDTVDADGDAVGASGLDLTFGVTENTAVSGVLAFEFAGDEDIGLADLELGWKRQVIRRADDNGAWGVAVAPVVSLPIGDGGVGVFLPVWIDYEAGDWGFFGGGGYTLHSGDHSKEFWSGAVAATRQVSSRVRLGVEYYAQSANEVGDDGSDGVRVGAEVSISERFSLLSSIGTSPGGDEGTSLFVGVMLSH